MSGDIIWRTNKYGNRFPITNEYMNNLIRNKALSKEEKANRSYKIKLEKEELIKQIYSKNNNLSEEELKELKDRYGKLAEEKRLLDKDLTDEDRKAAQYRKGLSTEEYKKYMEEFFKREEEQDKIAEMEANSSDDYWGTKAKEEQYQKIEEGKEGYNKLLNELDKRGMNYQISNSWNSGDFPSIYILDERGNEYRIADHYNKQNPQVRAFDYEIKKIYKVDDYINYKKILEDIDKWIDDNKTF